MGMIKEWRAIGAETHLRPHRWKILRAKYGPHLLGLVLLLPILPLALVGWAFDLIEEAAAEGSRACSWLFRQYRRGLRRFVDTEAGEHRWERFIRTYHSHRRWRVGGSSRITSRKPQAWEMVDYLADLDFDELVRAWRDNNGEL